MVLQKESVRIAKNERQIISPFHKQGKNKMALSAVTICTAFKLCEMETRQLNDENGHNPILTVEINESG